MRIKSLEFAKTYENEPIITVTVDKSQGYVVDELIKKYDDKAWQIEITRLVEKRSGEANRYLWEICTKLANKIGGDKDSIYLKMLKRYGVGGVLKVPDKCEKEVKQMCDHWEDHEKMEGEEVKYIRFWVGSSKYNTYEMFILLRGLVEEATEAGVDCRTPDEIAQMEATMQAQEDKEEKRKGEKWSS